MTNIERQKKLEAFMPGMAKAIDETLAKEFGKMGFVLILFDEDDASILNYLSNRSRENMVAALRQSADLLEKGESIPPAFKTIQ